MVEEMTRRLLPVILALATAVGAAACGGSTIDLGANGQGQVGATSSTDAGTSGNESNAVTGGSASGSSAVTGEGTSDGGGADTVESGRIDGGELVGTAWTLVAGAAPGGEIALVDGYPITLVFEGDYVVGTAACNGYGAEYSIEGNSFGASMVSQTSMGCEAAIQAAETAYLAALDDASTIRVEGGQLVLSGGSSELVFALDRPVPIDDIVGRLWLLESIIDNGESVDPEGLPATLLLGDDGTIEANTGCRELTGTYVVAVADIRFPDFAALGDCPTALWNQDGVIVNVLGDGFRPSLDGDRLVLRSRGNQSLVYRATSADEVASIEPDPVPSDIELLDGVEWILVAADAGDSTIEIPDPDDPADQALGVITLVLSPGGYQGELYCNRYGGALTIGAGTIAFGELTSTMAGCQLDGLAYADALAQVTAFGFDDPATRDRLVLTGDDTGTELVFERRSPTS